MISVRILTWQLCRQNQIYKNGQTDAGYHAAANPCYEIRRMARRIKKPFSYGYSQDGDAILNDNEAEEVGQER